MPVNSYKMGPGVLSIGGTDFSAQVRSCTVQVTENVKTTEAIDVLSGDQIPEEEEATYKYALQVTFLLDLAALGIVDYTWDNVGTSKAVTFTPNTAQGADVSGDIRIVPLNVGGDPKARMEQQVTFQFIGTPTYAA